MAAADFEIVGIEAGSTTLVIEAPALARAVPSFFQQQQLFESVDTGDSAFDVMEQALRAATEGRADSDLFDQALLATFRRFDHLLAVGFSSVELTDNGVDRGQLIVDRKSITAVDHLIRSTPEPRRIRVSGSLDTIRHSDRMFTLLLDDEKAVKGIAEEVAAEQLAGLFGQRVMVSGTAVFRPSGSLLRVEADAIDPASPDAAVWASVPVPLFRSIDGVALRQPQGPRSGVNAIIGRWPGEESDEEIAVALREMS